MTEIQELQKKIKGIRKKILKLKNKSPNDLHQINELIYEELKILDEIKRKVEIEKEINIKRKKLPRYEVKISYTDKQREKLKRESERIKAKYIKRPTKKKKKSKRKNKYGRKGSNKGRVKIKTSFEIFRASSYKPRPINRQAARAVGYRIKKK